MTVSSVALAGLGGCDHPVDHFDANRLYAFTVAQSRSSTTTSASRDVTAVVNSLFGSPGQPVWPVDFLVAGRGDTDITRDALLRLINPTRLSRAAGAVTSDREDSHTGLYREHCVACHGIAGNGTGPTSRFQSPYPRDFRPGVFKWKSTRRSAKPTRDDLAAVIRRGVVGTAMPSFTQLPSEDVDALVDHVIFLAIRGEIERRLIAGAIDDLGYDEFDRDEATAADEAIEYRLVIDGEPAAAGSAAGDLIVEVVARVVGDWLDAPGEITTVAAAPPEASAPSLAASIGRGRELFHGQIANCSGCHGPSGNGNAVMLDYDDWAKEYSTRLGITPSDRQAMRPAKSAGALPPRPIRPRDLRSGAFRSGGSAEQLFRVITEGVAGTPMPGVEVSAAGSKRGLSTKEVWDLIQYVQSLAEQDRHQQEGKIKVDRAVPTSLVQPKGAF